MRKWGLTIPGCRSNHTTNAPISACAAVPISGTHASIRKPRPLWESQR